MGARQRLDALPYDHDGKPGFERDFCVIETLYGSRERGEQHPPKAPQDPARVTNLSVLWRLFSQAVMRRRNEDTGDRSSSPPTTRCGCRSSSTSAS